MATTVSVNTSKVVASLTAQTPAKTKTRTLNLGYAAPYATYVHENLAMQHPRGGQAKYLQEPARKYAQQIGKVIQRALRNKRGLDVALVEGANYLLQKSLPLVPVDTGYLKSSHYIALV